MKRLLPYLTVLFLLFGLTACRSYEYDLDDFENSTVSTFYSAEHQTDNRYVVYYFDSTKSDLDTIRKDVLPFFDTFYALPYLFVDMANIETEISSFITREEDQYIIVYSNQNVIERYSGSEGVASFISSYQSIVFDYSMFEEQHIDSVEDLLSIDVDDYLVYAYSEASCDDCEEIKDTVLPWLFTKPVEQVYFINRDTVSGLDNISIPLQPLMEDEPTILLMSNGVASDESFIGKENVILYIESILDGPIVSPHQEFDYDDFSTVTLDHYNQVSSIEDELYFLYFYSPYCSHCAIVKESILPFFAQLDDIPYYIININDVEGTNPIPGVTGVPALYLLQDGIVVETYIGSLAIPNMILDYQEGNLDFDEYQ
jgi:thioredoxin-related protein